MGKPLAPRKQASSAGNRHYAWCPAAGGSPARLLPTLSRQVTGPTAYIGGGLCRTECSGSRETGAELGMQAPDSTGTKRLGINRSAAVGVALALFLLWWALRDVAFADVAARVRDVRLLSFFGSVALAVLAQLVLRPLRWQHMLRPNGRRLPYMALFHATAAGAMANCLLPARAGEFVRAYAARELTESRFSTAFGSIAVERVMDGLTLVAFLALVLAAGDFGDGGKVGGFTLTGIAAIGAAVFGLALLGSLLVVWKPGAVRWLSAKVVEPLLPGRLATRLSQILEGVIEGFDSLGNVNRTLTVIFWSMVLWGVNALSIWLGLIAFDISVPWTAAIIVQSLLGFAVAIPSSPGFFGPFEAAGKAALALYGVDASRALAFSAPYHLFAFVAPVTLVGLWSLSRTGLRISKLSRSKAEATPPSPPVSVAGAAGSPPQPPGHGWRSRFGPPGGDVPKRRT